MTSARQAPNHCRFLGRRRRGHPQRLTDNTSFTEELTGFKHGNDRFFAVLGDDRELDLARYNVVDGIGRIALSIDNLLGLEGGARSSGPDRRRKRAINEWRQVE
jgi:hypothetical protein